ncbi:hypothetical protein JCM11491_005172 [Sporobolomyces phaffii]
MTAHHQVVIAGGGISGLTALIQLKRKLGVTDVRLYEKGPELGGTWATNTYPGAACDIPISLYSPSFSPAKEFDSQWPAGPDILEYWRRLVDTHAVADSIHYRHVVVRAEFNPDTGLWTVEVRDVESGETTTETCHVFVSAVGALSTPHAAPFDTSAFDGHVVHTGKWDPDLDLEQKNVVVLGNGCSAAQFVPAVIDKVARLTQVARSAHSIVPPVNVPDNPWTNFLVRWIPGLFALFRFGVFMMCESYFWMNSATDDKARKGRLAMKKLSDRYIEKTAPSKYWDALKYDFEFGQKRRVIDFKGYTAALHAPHFALVHPDTIATAVGRTVTTRGGVVLDDVDVVVLSTGFDVTASSLEVVNADGETLAERWDRTGVKTYLTSMVASFPNFFILMGPNSITGHSSVLFNTECTVDMMINLVRPVFAALSKKGEDASSTSTLSDREDEEEKPVSSDASREFSTSPVDEKFDFHREGAEGGVQTRPASSSSSSLSSPVASEFPPPRGGDHLAVAAAAPTVEVTQAAEDAWYADMRREMETKIWEAGVASAAAGAPAASMTSGRKVSWYTDSGHGGKCTQLYPWSQIHFKQSTGNIVKGRFRWTHC